MRIGAFELSEPLPALREPHALAMLRPWIDVGSVGTLTVVGLESRLGAKEVGRLARPGNFFDFTRYRPTAYLKVGRREMSIPNTTITYARLESGHDFLFLSLLEPHMLGEFYVDSVLRVLSAVGVKRYCLLGSMYDMVPHTKKLLVSGGALGLKAQQDLGRTGSLPTDYQGPSTISFLISQRAPQLDIESMWFVVHLPQYVRLEEDYMGKVRLMEILGTLYGVAQDEADIHRAEQQLNYVNSAVDASPELKAIMPQIEAHYEARLASRKEDIAPLPPEMERFLRDLGNRFGQN
jgi:hypothetical protein